MLLMKILKRYLVEATDSFDVLWAVELDIPLIIVNHTVSELAGIRELAQHLQAQFPQVPVHYIPQRCVYNLVFA